MLYLRRELLLIVLLLLIRIIFDENLLIGQLDRVYTVFIQPVNIFVLTLV